MSRDIPHHIANLPRRIFGLDVAEMNPEVLDLFEQASGQIEEYFTSLAAGRPEPEPIFAPSMANLMPPNIKLDPKTGKLSYADGQDKGIEEKKYENLFIRLMFHSIHRKLLLGVIPEFKSDLTTVQAGILMERIVSPKGISVEKRNEFLWETVLDFERRWRVQISFQDGCDDYSLSSCTYSDSHYPQPITIADEATLGRLQDELATDKEARHRYLVVDTRMPLDAVASVMKMFFPKAQGSTPFKFKIFGDRIRQDLQLVKCPPRTPYARAMFLKNTNRPLYDAYMTTVEGRRHKFRKGKGYDFVPLEPSEEPSEEFLELFSSPKVFGKDPETRENAHSSKKSLKDNKIEGRQTIILEAWDWEFKRLTSRLEHLDKITTPLPDFGNRVEGLRRALIEHFSKSK